MTPDLGSIFSYLFISLVLVSGVREQRLSFTIYLACCCWLKTVLLLCRGKCRKHVYILILFFRETSHIWKVWQPSFIERINPIASAPSHLHMPDFAQDLPKGPTNLWPSLPCPRPPPIASSASNVQKPFPFFLDHCNPSFSSLFHL